MIKSYDFLIYKMIEKTLPPKDGQLAGTVIFKVLYLVVDESYQDAEDSVFTGCVDRVKDFYIGYLSAKDARSVTEGMFVRGMFDEKGKIKLIN